MNKSLVLYLVLAFALVAGFFLFYKEGMRPSQLEVNTWNKYSAAGKWHAQLSNSRASAVIGDSHIVELDFGKIDSNPIQILAYRGATTLLLKNLTDSSSAFPFQSSVIMLGTNDVLFGIDLETSNRRLDRFIAEYQSHEKAKIVLVNVPPLLVSPGLFTRPQQVEMRLREYNEMLSLKAEIEGVHLIDLHSEMQASGEPRDYLREDGIHLNDLGYALLTTLINDELGQ